LSTIPAKNETIEVENGATVMEAAIRNAIPASKPNAAAPAPARPATSMSTKPGARRSARTPMEKDMLDFGFDVRPNSRLSCQIR
jgi:2Fe-2S ferredoxin